MPVTRVYEYPGVSQVSHVRARSAAATGRKRRSDPVSSAGGTETSGVLAYMTAQRRPAARPNWGRRRPCSSAAAAIAAAAGSSPASAR